MPVFKTRDAAQTKKGTSMVSILVPEKAIPRTVLGAVFQGWNHPYVALTANGKTVGAIVDAIRNGAGELTLDPLLRLELNIPEGSPAEVEPLAPFPAEKVEIEFPGSGLTEGELKSLCLAYLLGQPLSQGQSKQMFLYSGKPLDVKIRKVQPNDLCILTKQTQIISILTRSSLNRAIFSDVGGLDRKIEMLKERVIRPLQHREFFAKMGITIPRGILFHGPPGCGKTLLARALSRELGLACIEVKGPEVFAGLVGESEKRIREIFSEAREKRPCLVIIDEVDAVAPCRRKSGSELERRITTSLLAEMDGLQEAEDIIVVATTNVPDSIDIALRRPGRLDFEIRIGAPDRAARRQILEIHSRRMPLNDVSLDELAGITHGFSGADLMNLCREAAFCALKHSGQALSIEEEGIECKEPTRISNKDFQEALKGLAPSALREFSVEVPTHLSWDCIGGLDQIRKTLVEELVRALKDPEPFVRLGIRPLRGVLLYGPPGTGKTLLARVIANQAEANFIVVRGPEILSKWVGESERRVREIFETARQVSPSAIFWDEIDAITAARGRSTSDVADRIVNQLLTEMDSFHTGKQVCVIAATNRRDLLDPALLRPGRFDLCMEVPLPGPEERKRIFEIHLRDKPLSEDLDLEFLHSDANLDGFSGAHIEEACRRAALEALREASFRPEEAVLVKRHLVNAIRAVRRNIEELEGKMKPMGF